MSNDPETTNVPDHETREAQATTRSEQTSTHDAQAKTQTEQATTRAAQAETHAEQATTRSTQAATHSEQTSTRTKQTETQAAQDKTRDAQTETQIEQDQTRATQAETQSRQASTRIIEQALGVSELSYRRVFEAAQDGILILDVATGRINDVNPFLVQLLGFSREEMLGKTVGELSPFKDVVSNQAMLEHLQQDGYVRYEDLPMKTKDGHDIAVEFVSNVYRAGDKKVIQCNIRDITNRKQAEANSNLLASIVESSDDAIFCMDLNNVFTSWNRGAEKIYGYAASEMIGAPISKLIPADRLVAEMELLERIKADEKLSHIETVRRTKAGRLIDVSVTASAIKDASGKIVGVSKTAREISERKRAATALLESKRFLQSTLNALSAHIAILDEHGTIVEVNAAWDRFARENRLLGKGGLGANYLQVCHSATGHFCEEAPAVAGGIHDVMAGKKTEFHLEYPCHGPKERRWFVVRVTRFDGDGPVRVVVAHENITERKLAELSLRESEGKFRQIAETINEVFWITDATMHQMIYVSPAYEKIWGRTCQSLYNAPRTWLEAIHAEDRERVLSAVTAGLAKDGYDESYRIQRPDGSVRWIHDHAVPLRNAAGEIQRFIGIAGDCTENRKLEDAFRQAQKMESIGQLAGGIAHDFNNILAGIVGNLYLAKMDAAEQPAILDSLENIAAASQRATDLVKQILTFSRQVNPEREPVKLNHVVLEALKLLRSSVPSTIRIQTELAEVPTVLANATAIHQVLMNLGTNAWHAMRHQAGLLKIEMNVLEVDEDFAKIRPDLHPGNYVQLSVSDSGCGMDAATLNHIFEPFFTTKAVGEGTGLGLAVVHGIMKAHDGGISVYSQPGMGTTFRLFFPVIEIEEVPGKLEAASIPRGRGEHILFVDDEDMLAKVGKRMLERLGYVVTTHTNPLEAIADVRDRAQPFDLVITDFTMPGMDGAKLGEQLLQMQPRLPIIITTGYSGVMTAAKVSELGFRELLSKPSTAQTLGETVHRVLQSAASTKT
jgi:PAS domain S-box-containing protein